MTRRAWIGFSLLIASTSIVHGDLPNNERAKIEKLLDHVANLKDSQFVRNGTPYSAATAVKFLRGKWDANEDAIHTAKDFIEIAASKSSTSGRPYLIRFKDGSEEKSAEYLIKVLEKL